ncbi:MAG: hypothetical protein GEU97_13605 [Actinophytocola sp.]|nr:hypothetical protein [Actinophytocola sp.]
MTNRRRSTPSGGSRRPQVAGLRKPSPRPRPTPEPRQDQTDTEASTAAGAATGAAGTESGSETVAAPPASPRPRPRSKTRDEGARKPETPDETVSHASALPEGRSTTKQPRREPSWAMTSVVGALALVLALTAAFFAFKYFSVDAGDENKAMVDVVATEQLKQQVGDGVEAMFSYDYNNVEQHEKAVKDVLATDEMRSQYEQLMGDVKDKAPQQKVVLQTAVRNIAVIEMTDDTARVLAFIDQTSIREDTGQSAATGDQPTITVVKVDGEWKISHIDAYADPSNRAPVPGGSSGNGGNGGN